MELVIIRAAVKERGNAMISTLQRLSSSLYHRNKRLARPRLTNTHLSLISDTSRDHITTLLEHVQALLQTYGCFEEKQRHEDSPPFTLHIGSQLDRGNVREREPNEDSLFIAQSILHPLDAPPNLFAFFVVADGMGGHESGQEASQLAIVSLAEYIYTALCSKELQPD